MNARDHQINSTFNFSSNRQKEVSDEELLQVIADFLEMGHVENIVAMFKQDSRYYQWVGWLLKDERFAVRLGVSVLFQYLKEERPEEIVLAIPSLTDQLNHPESWVRGEVLSVLAIIGSAQALSLIKHHQNDPSPQVREIVQDILEVPYG